MQMNQANQVLNFPKAKESPRQKFIQLLQRRFEKNYAIQLQLLELHQVEQNILCSLCPKKFLTVEKTHYLGIFKKNQLKTVFAFSSKEEISQEHLEKCHMILLEIALPYFEQIERVNELRQEVQKGRAAQNIGKENNVLPLFRRNEADESILNVEPHLATIIFGSDQESIFRKAVDLHQESENICFLRYQDIAEQDRNSVEGLESLGATTLFVPNLLVLPEEAQSTLIELAEKTSKSSLCVISGVLDQKNFEKLNDSIRQSLGRRILFT